jgi:hypothetical protein
LIGRRILIWWGPPRGPDPLHFIKGIGMVGRSRCDAIRRLLPRKEHIAVLQEAGRYDLLCRKDDLLDEGVHRRAARGRHVR